MEARAPDHLPIAGKAVKVDGGEEVPFDIELPKNDDSENEPEASQRATKERAVAKKPAPVPNEAPPATNVEELPSDDTKKASATSLAPLAAQTPPRPVAAPAVAAPPVAPQPQATQATLNLNSIPATNVVIDGRPLGRTPKIGVAVAPGSHSVVFIHPEHGRKVRQVSVQAGQTATATAQFP